MNRRLLLLGVLLASVLAGAAAAQAPLTLRLPAPATQYGQLAAVPLVGPNAPAYAGPPTPHSLAGVRIVPEVRSALAKPGVAQTLARQGFVVVPSDLRLFHFAYDGNVYSGWPVFVTTDVAYHEWHLVLDKVLRDLEQQVLLPKLQKLVAGLVQAAHAQAGALAATPVAGDAARVEQLYQVAAAELGLPVALGPLAAAEKALVDAHGRAQTSPILGTKIDYSLYTPRGHYTRTAALRRYFAAMSVLSQAGFCLPGTTGCSGLEPARLAILASRVLVANASLLALWRRIYEPTAFLVGAADDYTPLEVARAAGAGGLGDATAVGSDAAVKAIVAELAKARPVMIDPERAAIRLMPTRFVLDAFVLDQLLSPNVGTAAKPRLVPSGLDVAAAFGSDFAYQALKRAGQTAYANYDIRLSALRKAIAARPAAAWGATVYDAWLHALEPSFTAHGKAFPDFMRTAAWAAKAHQSGLGSYAELKHDTILYAKQAVAEGGDNLTLPARRNWVEPEPAAFGRLAAVADLLRRGLSARQLLSPSAGGLLRDETGMFRFFERIARDELAAKPIAAKDNQRLTFIGSELEGYFWRTADRAADGAPEADPDAAIAADISTSSKGIREVATGRIDRIYVLVPADDGTFEVAVGGVYSYYELTSPPGSRLSDETWRAMLDAGRAPARPAWEKAIFPR